MLEILSRRNYQQLSISVARVSVIILGVPIFINRCVAEEKLKVLQALVQQLLTYVSVRDIIEDSHEKLRQVRNELRQYQWAGQRRDRDEANFW